MTTCRNCKKELESSDSFCRQCGQVVFADENLEAAVREELEKPEEPLTKGVIRELTGLGAVGGVIEYLRGLEFAVNLTRLMLPENQISDASPITSLKSAYPVN